MVAYKHAAHARYGKSGFNRTSASSLTSWTASTPGCGRAIRRADPATGSACRSRWGGPTPSIRTSCGGSTDTCYAIDPTGAHILNEKVRGKLLTIPNPKIVLITRGRVSRDFSSLETEDGWTMVRPLTGRAPSPEYFTSIRDALVRLSKEATAADNE